MSVHDVSGRLGDLLRQHRRAAGLTQEQLAERAGVSPRSVSELERGGAHVPRRDTTALLARALGLDGAERAEFESLVEQRRLPASASPVAQAQRYVHNLPRALTSFVGRESDLEVLAPLVHTTPLLTLTGSGGVGKTRLAQEVARAQLHRFSDGCWLAELAGLADAALVASAVAGAVGFEDAGKRNLAESLVDYLAEKQLLLVLDNCEHLVESCADLAQRLLAGCPGVHILATSREPLNIPGEVVRRVFPLELPDLDTPVALNQLTHVPAVHLFVERAAALDQQFALTPETATAIARICIGLDGIPLALELAAARTRMLSVEQLADRLDQDTSLLVTTSRSGLAQHRTMRATLDWSHDLLSVEEQTLLRRLSVFANGWPLKSAEQVCCGDGIEPGAVLDILSRLVDRSMVQVDVRDSTARYRLLEPVRQYAAERLEASGEAATYRDRQCDVMFALVFSQQAGAAGPDEIVSLDQLEAEHANLRTALRWGLTNERSAEVLRCTSALFRFWERRGHFQEGCVWLTQALEAAPPAPTPERGWALNSLAFLYWRGGDLDRAQEAADEALTVCRAVGLPRDAAQVLLNLGMIAYLRDQPDAALKQLEASVAAAREGGMPSQLSLALTFLGRARLRLHGAFDSDTANLLYESLAVAQGAQSRYSTGHALVTLGELMWRQHRVDDARALWREALAVRAELTDRRGVASCLERLALALAVRGEFHSAAWLFAAASTHRRALGITLRDQQAIDHDRLLDGTRRTLGTAFDSVWAAGRAASLQEAVRTALTESAQ